MPVVNVYVYIFTSTFLIFVCSLLLIMCFYKIKGCKASNSRLSLLFFFSLFELHFKLSVNEVIFILMMIILIK